MTAKSSSAKSTAATISTPSLEELTAKIHELIQQKEEIVAQEKDAIVVELMEKIRLFDITPEELGFPSAKKRGRPARNQGYQEPSSVVSDSEAPEVEGAQEDVFEMTEELEAA